MKARPLGSSMGALPRGEWPLVCPTAAPGGKHAAPAREAGWLGQIHQDCRGQTARRAWPALRQACARSSPPPPRRDQAADAGWAQRLNLADVWGARHREAWILAESRRLPLPGAGSALSPRPPLTPLRAQVWPALSQRKAD